MPAMGISGGWWSSGAASNRMFGNLCPPNPARTMLGGWMDGLGRAGCRGMDGLACWKSDVVEGGSGGRGIEGGGRGLHIVIRVHLFEQVRHVRHLLLHCPLLLAVGERAGGDVGRDGGRRNKGEFHKRCRMLLSNDLDFFSDFRNTLLECIISLIKVRPGSNCELGPQNKLLYRGGSETFRHGNLAKNFSDHLHQKESIILERRKHKIFKA